MEDEFCQRKKLILRQRLVDLQRQGFQLSIDLAGGILEVEFLLVKEQEARAKMFTSLSAILDLFSSVPEEHEPNKKQDGTSRVVGKTPATQTCDHRQPKQE